MSGVKILSRLFLEGKYQKVAGFISDASGTWLKGLACGSGGAYGTPMSKAPENLTTVEAVHNNEGRFLYHIFKLKYTEKQFQEVKGALKSLGYPETKHIELEAIDKTRCKVIYSGHLTIGIYDFSRHTFID